MRLMLPALMVLVCGCAQSVGPPVITDPTDRQILDAYLEQVEKSAAYCNRERMRDFARQPEDIVWQASRYIRMPLIAYKLTGDATYLDSFIERMDALRDWLSEGPDGYLGWYGLPLELFRDTDRPGRTVDVVLVSFEMAGLLADFVTTVRADEKLRGKYEAVTAKYLNLATEHLVRKWDRRGNYKELGAMGAVYVTHGDLKPTKAHLTQPHNKHSKILQALTSLYVATGRDEYLVKAIRLGTRFKRCLTLVEDRYRWDYWDPAGAWDVDPEKPDKWKHWIGVEHRGGYYNLSLSGAVWLYEHGLVFDRTDIRRFVKTQTEVCWNGSYDEPKWARTDGRAMDKVYLCGWLSPFNEQVREMACGAPAQRERLANRGHPWQGGPVAMDWLELKYVTLPSWAGGNPAEAERTAAFRSSAAGRALLEELAYEVAGTGYQAPATPQEMAAASAP